MGFLELAVFLICADENLTWKHPKEQGHSMGNLDASIVCTHMMLQALELRIVQKSGEKLVGEGENGIEDGTATIYFCQC